jgi:hypothetical protein
VTFSDSDVLSDWPSLDELKQWRDVTGSEWDGTGDESDGGGESRFSRELAAAIAIVKLDVGDWDELTDLPDAQLGEAAMRMAVLLRANAGESTALLRDDPQYQACLKGHRRRFAIA